ncbi:unnamed protein product [Malus baccata var. baccata]
MKFTWGDDPDPEMTEPPPDLVLGSDVIYNEGAVLDLVSALRQLSGGETTIFLVGELRNDAVLEYFWNRQWHPEYCSSCVVLYVLVRSEVMWVGHCLEGKRRIQHEAFWELTDFGFRRNSEVKREGGQSTPMMGDPLESCL